MLRVVDASGSLSGDGCGIALSHVFARANALVGMHFVAVFVDGNRRLGQRIGEQKHGGANPWQALQYSTSGTTARRREES